MGSDPPRSGRGRARESALLNSPGVAVRVGEVDEAGVISPLGVDSWRVLPLPVVRGRLVPDGADCQPDVFNGQSDDLDVVVHQSPTRWRSGRELGRCPVWSAATRRCNTSLGSSPRSIPCGMTAWPGSGASFLPSR